MSTQRPNPSGNDVEKAALINKCNDFMIIVNSEMRRMARKTKINTGAPNA